MSDPPRTYDEITARTVPDPDSSYRPTKEEEREALARVDPPRDEVLLAGVRDALRELGAGHVSVETDGVRVTLHGAVADMATWRRIDERVRAVEGVESIDNRTHVG